MGARGYTCRGDGKKKGGALKRSILLTALVLLLSAGAARAAPPEPGGPNGLPGVQTYRIEEPVFKGQAHVYEAGAGRARSIVLIHGVNNNGAHDFRELIPWLAQDFHVVAFDLPGFGRSTKANVIYSPANYAAFVKHVADRFIRGPFVLLGHSLGGVVSLRYAATYPRDVERLIVVDVPGVLHRLSFTSYYLTHLGMDFLSPFVRSGEQIGNLANRILDRAESMRPNPKAVLASRERRETVLGGDPAKIAGLALVLEDLTEALPAIEAPALIVWGANDTLAPPRTGRLLELLLPRARLAMLNGVGHAPMLEDPPGFRAAIDPFLRGVEEGAAAVPAEQDKPAPAGPVNGECKRRHDAVFEGEYDKLTIVGCRGVRVRRARIRELRIIRSTVDLEDSDIAGGKIGLFAHSSTVTVTGGAIEAEVAIEALKSRLDLAGVRLTATTAAVRAPARSTVVFSVSRIESPHTQGAVHDYFVVTPDAPL
jgi:pimeloyl-ACP methyl ester carboxylesterase